MATSEVLDTKHFIPPARLHSCGRQYPSPNRRPLSRTHCLGPRSVNNYHHEHLPVFLLSHHFARAGTVAVAPAGAVVGNAAPYLVRAQLMTPLSTADW